jgi:hypothetical protein
MVDRVQAELEEEKERIRKIEERTSAREEEMEMKEREIQFKRRELEGWDTLLREKDEKLMLDLTRCTPRHRHRHSHDCR